MQRVCEHSDFLVEVGFGTRAWTIKVPFAPAFPNGYIYETQKGVSQDHWSSIKLTQIRCKGHARAGTIHFAGGHVRVIIVHFQPKRNHVIGSKW
jgi:hypothetical protein